MACSHPVSAGLVWLADYLTSREGNTDMVNTINPADCKPGEVYEGRVHGVERAVLVRRDSADSYPWESLSEVLDHEDVSDLVRLVPARPVTRQDLPDIYAAYSKVIRQDCGDLTPSDMGPVLDAVVERLNANGVAPASGLLSDAADCVLESAEQVRAAKAEADRWRRAHEIVEGERDLAREQWKKWEHKANEWKVRAEAAERSRGWFRDRAEAAEARTAPAVTRDQRDKVADHLRDKMVRACAKSFVRDAVARAFTAAGIDTAIETTAPDPVAEKARELWDVAHPDGPYRWDDLLEEVSDKWLRIARHVLGADQ